MSGPRRHFAKVHLRQFASLPYLRPTGVRARGLAAFAPVSAVPSLVTVTDKPCLDTDGKCNFRYSVVSGDVDGELVDRFNTALLNETGYQIFLATGELDGLSLSH